MKRVTRAELVDELDAMNQDQPYTADTVDWVANTLGRPRDWVAERLGAPAVGELRAR